MRREGTQHLGLLVRRAAKTDRQALLELLEELLPGEASKSQGSKMLGRGLRDEGYDLFVATLGRDIAGLVDVWTFPDVGEGANLSTIQNLIVRSAFRGRGVADSLLEKAIATARKRRTKEIHVSTMAQNTRAIGLYKKHGFTKKHLLLEKSPL